MTTSNQIKVANNTPAVAPTEPKNVISLNEGGARVAKAMLSLRQMYSELMDQLTELYTQQIKTSSAAIESTYTHSMDAAKEDRTATQFQAGASFTGAAVAFGTAGVNYTKSRGVNQEFEAASTQKQGLEEMYRSVNGANNGAIVAEQGQEVAPAQPIDQNNTVDNYVEDVLAGRFERVNGATYSDAVKRGGNAQLTNADKAHIQGLIDTQSRNVNSAEMRLQGIRSDTQTRAQLAQGISEGSCNMLSAQQRFKSKQDEAEAAKKAATQNLAKESYEDASQQRKALAQEQISEADALQRMLSTANARG